jgi:hypothetical protein
LEEVCKLLAVIYVVSEHENCLLSIKLNNVSHQRSGKLPGARGLCALFMLSLFLSVLAVAQFESLHHAVHQDSDHPDHHCAATLLQTGQVETPVGASTPVIIRNPVCVPRPIESTVALAADLSLPPSCGPPTLLS